MCSVMKLLSRRKQRQEISRETLCGASYDLALVAPKLRTSAEIIIAVSYQVLAIRG